MKKSNHPSKRFIILLGPHGSGKGTQARLLSELFKIPHLSTGNIIRRAVEKGTELGKLAIQYLDHGAYLPDEVVNNLIEKYIAEDELGKGAIFDGYPRTRPQAEFLEGLLPHYVVIYLSISEDEVRRRFRGRLICENGHVFHKTFNAPKVSGICDVDGLTLEEREDDTDHARMDERLRLYRELTEPLLAFYRDKGRLMTVDGTRSINEVFKDIQEKISLYDRTAK